MSSVNDLRKHKKEHHSHGATFNCSECDKPFKDECMLNEHVQNAHKSYSCDDCDKVFHFEGLLEKHRSATHEGIALFCHYFNNNKECPFENRCIFLHEESENCKFDKACERILCMYKHDDGRDISDNESDESSDDEEPPESEKPSLENVRITLENVDEIFRKVSPNLKCDKCEFEAKNSNGLVMHKKAKHTNKS